jgi:hypothetical protein
MSNGTEGQDRANYTDTQDRDSYTVPVKRGRGRPKGSKNKPKELKANVADPISNIGEASTEPVIEKNPYILDGDPTAIDGTCLACTKFLLCKQAKKRGLIVCDKYENNFAVMDETSESGEEDQEYQLSEKLYVCNSIDEVACKDCPHSVPHIPEDIAGDCVLEATCTDANKPCKCIAVEGDK